MRCLSIIISVFVTVSAIRVPVIPSSSIPKKPLVNSIKFNDSNYNTTYVAYLPQNNEKQQYRPSNLKKIIPNDWVPIVPNTKYKKDQLIFNIKGLKRKARNNDASDKVEEDFVSTQLLAQTRHNSNEEYLPPDEDEPRLREAIKDTKVHVEYTEEGYEDTGYDHAGEERNEDFSEGYQAQRSDPTQAKQYGQLQVDIEKEFENYEKVNHEDEDQEEGTNKSKRFTNDIIKIDDYLATVRVETTSTVPIREKYPYYKNKKMLNRNSALRYAEDIKNIPLKKEGDLSFYKHTKAFNCEEIPLNINPLPNVTEGNKTSILKGPRLKNLGGKIACLKNKYFGTNPLDNPLFEETDIEQLQPFAKMLRSKRSLTSVTEIIKKNDLEEPLPESAPLRLRKRRRKYPVVPLQRPLFRRDSFLPTPVPPLFVLSSTLIPRYKTISEVYYKDEIQPSEQLNVFADVMNNIKKIRTDLVVADSDVIEDTRFSSEESSVKMKVPTRKIKIRQSHIKKSEPSTTSTTTTTTTERTRTRRRNKYKNHKPDPQLFEEYIHAVKEKEVVLRKENNKLEEPLTVESNNLSEVSQIELDDVIGLNPPVEVTAMSTLHSFPSLSLNTFPVPGMRPPFSYFPSTHFHYVNPKNNRIRRKNNFHIIHKRSPQKPAYSEIRRNKGQLSTEPEEDDYVPKRNRNFRYDTESKRVIYTKQDRVPIEEVIDEQEVEIEPSTTTTTTTTTEAEPSFLDYVHQVKTHKQYQYIMEPTEKPLESSTTQQYTTVSTNTIIPDFLNIVSKLKENDGYIVYPEKETTTAKTTTTTETIEELPQEFQVFDISEYLPKQEEYIAPVPINYSKYKNIERKPTNTTSSRYSQEEADQKEEDQLTTSTKIKTTSTTTEIPLTTTKRTRARTRRRPVTSSTSTTESSSVSAPPRSRRRFRSTTQSTTTATQETTSQTYRPVTRRLPNRSVRTTQKLPSNHKAVYTPIEGIDNLEQKGRMITEEPVVVAEKTSEFYSDTNLPQIVNQLKEESVKYPPQGDDNKEVEVDAEVEEPISKPINIVKDPSKRLYYYVPVK